jgi:hypothetical protein
VFADLTFGGGGHSKAILEASGKSSFWRWIVILMRRFDQRIKCSIW